MSDLRCPHCGDRFRVPDADLPPGATAQCPWCRDVFPVSQLLAALPPMAQLVDEDGQPLLLARSAGSATTSVLGEDSAGLNASSFAEQSGNLPTSASDSALLADEIADLRSDNEEPSDEPFDSDDFQVQTDYGFPVEPRPLQDVSDMTFGREDRGFATKPRVRKKSSPIRSILGIVIGGLLAFPLAAGLLALFGSPLDLGFWPFDGRTIARGVSTHTAAPVTTDNSRSRPGAAPQGRSLADELPGDRGGTMPAEDEAQPETIAPAESQSTPPTLPSTDVAANAEPEATSGAPMTMPRATAPELVEPIVADEDAPDQRDAGTQSPQQTTSYSAADDDIPVELPAAQTPIEPVTLDREDSQVSQPPTEEPAADDGDPQLAAPELSAAAPEAVVEVNPPHRGSSPELKAALIAADEALESVQSYQDEEGPAGLKPRLATLYASVAAVGEIAQREDEPELTTLIDRLEAGNLINHLAPAAPNWAKYSRRPNDGMLAIGPLRRENEKWYLDWTGSIPLEIRSIDETTVEEHTQVLVLGRLIESETALAIEATLVKPIQ